MAVNLDTYYTESRKILERSAKQIKNPGVFDFNYLPKQVFIREEAKTILDNIVKFDRLRVPFNLFIYGARGSGKTVLLKYLTNYLKEKIKTPMMYIYSTRFLHMVSPKPVPVDWRVDDRSTWVKASNRDDNSSCGIPTPLSVTLNLIAVESF